MKTKLMSLAVAVLVAAAGFSASAQDKKDKKECKKPRKEMVAAKGECKAKCEKPCKDAKVEKKNRMDMLLEGITLTPEQQAQVAEMQQKSKAEFEKKKQERKAEKAKKDAEKREKAAKMQNERMQKLDADMKSILTPEQYTVFQQNVEKVKAKRLAKKDSDKGNRKKAKKREMKSSKS